MRGDISFDDIAVPLPEVWSRKAFVDTFMQEIEKESKTFSTAMIEIESCNDMAAFNELFDFLATFSKKEILEL